MERQEPVWQVTSDGLVEDAHSVEVTSLLCWRGPLLLAIAGHGLLLLLLNLQTWQRPVEPEVMSAAIEAYFYQAPTKVELEPVAPNQEPLLAKELVADAIELMAEPEAVNKEAVLPATSTEPALIADVDMVVIADKREGAERPVVESTALPSGTNQRGSLMDRALRHVQPTDELASAHRAQQIQRHAQPSITVEKRYQEIQDGSQPIRNARGCLTSDPSKDGFDALMAAKYVPCGDEISAAQQLQEILQRRSRHSGRSN
ncbi:hypothetical protein [Alkalimonas mucilaginosa]|uniref:Uncharacterized protein n=1 Tax=Alkalimonas mucilaginosa TaxID=3057676 RepID=A0ABU7JID8_9GAMM|nr:hypothetical protein [Alkalimonas sp. MEB004]MEE2025467.1 hypothetical protein [Alkalimonas sp. MEB004]